MEMKAYLYIVIISVSIQLHVRGLNNTSDERDKILREKYGPVIYANLVYRHGDRTIVKPYPTDPHKNSSHWDIGFKQLTKEGQLRHYKLGKWIKSRYPELVGDKYQRENIYVFSSDGDISIMSAQCNLAGMYPVKSADPPFQPVPIHTIPASLDNIFHYNVPCTNYITEKEIMMKSKYKTHEMETLYRTLSNLTGMEIDNLRDVHLIYDILRVEHEDMNLELPDWTHHFYPHLLRDLTLKEYQSYTLTHQMKRLKAGPLFTDMVKHLEMKANGTLNPDRKLWIYSGHNGNLVDLLVILNLHAHNITVPSFASLIAMELRRKEGHHFVTLIYKDGEDDSTVELRIKGCERACTLQQFLQLTKNMTITNWKEECTPRNSNSQVNIGYTEILFVFLLLLCPGMIFAFCFQPKNEVRYKKIDII